MLSEQVTSQDTSSFLFSALHPPRAARACHISPRASFRYCRHCCTSHGALRRRWHHGASMCCAGAPAGSTHGAPSSPQVGATRLALTAMLHLARRAAASLQLVSSVRCVAAPPGSSWQLLAAPAARHARRCWAPRALQQHCRHICTSSGGLRRRCSSVQACAALLHRMAARSVFRTHRRCAPRTFHEQRRHRRIVSLHKLLGGAKRLLCSSALEFQRARFLLQFWTRCVSVYSRDGI